nr:LysR substrate-binding domain-containing protein [uncultured Azohydromonas sp.]
MRVHTPDTVPPGLGLAAARARPPSRRWRVTSRSTSSNWALDGHGTLMRAEWRIERYLQSGRLAQVLPQYYTPDADIHAVYPQRHQVATRVRAFVDFVALSLARQAKIGKS